MGRKTCLLRRAKRAQFRDNRIHTWDGELEKGRRGSTLLPDLPVFDDTRSMSKVTKGNPKGII